MPMEISGNQLGHILVQQAPQPDSFGHPNIYSLNSPSVTVFSQKKKRTQRPVSSVVRRRSTSKFHTLNPDEVLSGRDMLG